MRLSIFGLGYVGCVSAACFAKAGHNVIGVDVNELKVNIINDGKSPIVEPGIDALIAETRALGHLSATTDTEAAILDTDISIVCVGTPGQPNGSLDLTYIKRVCQEIGAAIEKKRRFHIVVLRSTMLPGTVYETVVPTLEVFSNRKARKDFGVAVNPEFLREGTSIRDFHAPPFTLIGADDEETASILQKLYDFVDARTFVVGVREAEMVKYACNCFHAAKVAFANEIGNICQAVGVDSHAVMHVFSQDTKLNLSAYYLKPGFAFGGSCLPKDLRALTYKAKTVDAEVPMLNAILASNRHQIDRAIDVIVRTGKKKIGVLGMSFKAGTDDLRESPIVTLIETLLGKGCHIGIHDPDVELARIFGANKQYIEREIPHISTLMKTDMQQVVDAADVIIIGKNDERYRGLLDTISPQKTVIDLVKLTDVEKGRPGYIGINW